MNKGVHDKEETVEEKQIQQFLLNRNLFFEIHTTLRIDQPIKIEATDATVQLQMMVIIFLLQDPSKLKLKSNIEHNYSAHNKLEPLK